MIRKLRKAQWVYECPGCGWVSFPSPDLFGAREAAYWHPHMPEHQRWLHQRELEAVIAAGRIVAQAYMDFGQAVVNAFQPAVEALASAFAPPLNIPHDPAMLRDRRKWGGR